VLKQVNERIAINNHHDAFRWWRKEADFGFWTSTQFNRMIQPSFVPLFF
jgi:hypothetical protein